MGGLRRTVAIAAVAVLVGSLGACSSDSNAQAPTKQQRVAAAAAKRAKQTARRQRQAARRQARQRLRARVAAQHRARQRAQHARLLRARRTRATGSPARDRAAIQRSVHRLNAAFDRSVERGIERSVALNYWADAGVYDPAACATFAIDEGDGVVAETLLIRPGTVRATPGWVDPAVGRTPRGRLYVVTVDEIQTLVPTGEQRIAVHDLHASVGRDGRARLFFRCG